MKVQNLISKWNNHLSVYRANAEQAFFAGDNFARGRWDALIRQWEYAIDDLKKVLEDEEKI